MSRLKSLKRKASNYARSARTIPALRSARWTIRSVLGRQGSGEDLSTSLERARIAWLKAMSSYTSSPNLMAFAPIAMLAERHLEQCKILPDRHKIIERMKRGGKAAEVGVEAGKFSQALLDLCQPATLHLIDKDLRRFDIEKRFSADIAEGRVVLHGGDSSVVIEQFPDKYFDFIYIDADHSYNGVWKDINASVNKIVDDGFLIFNDYTYWSSWECMPYGVMQAVNEFCIQNDWEAVYFSFGQFMYCDIAVRRRRG